MLRVIFIILYLSVFGLKSFGQEFPIAPRPAPEGGNYYFPFPDESEPYADLELLESLDSSRDSKNSTIYANSMIRQSGPGVEVRSKNIILT